MRLLIDIGNSRIKWGWSARPGEVSKAGHSVDARSLMSAWSACAKPQEILIADVRGGQDAVAITRLISELSWPEPQIVVSQACFGRLRIAYPEASAFGVDRFLALVAVTQVCSTGVVVVSAGTALTIDGLGSDGIHRGGVILPGLQAGMAALGKAAPILRDRANPREAQLSPWAVDTETALGNGLLYAWAGGAERAVVDMRARLGGACALVLTGGDGRLLDKWLKFAAYYDEHLILRGMTYL